MSDELLAKNSRPLQEQAVAFSRTSGHRDPTTSTGGLDGSALNPEFVEALMGLPARWSVPRSDSMPSGTASFRSRQLQLFSSAGAACSGGPSNEG